MCDTGCKHSNVPFHLKQAVKYITNTDKASNETTLL